MYNVPHGQHKLKIQLSKEVLSKFMSFPEPIPLVIDTLTSIIDVHLSHNYYKISGYSNVLLAVLGKS
jgi:hypothetical protein